MKSLIISTFCMITLFASLAVAQSPDELKSDYETKLSDWRETIKEIRKVGVKYLDAEDAFKAKSFRKDWTELRQTGRAQIKELITAAMALYKVAPTPELNEFLQKVQDKTLNDGESEKAYQLGKLLLKSNAKNEDIQLATACAAIKTNRFDEAAQFAATYGTMISGLGEVERDMFENLKTLQSKYDRELALQKAEAEADDLPRVRFKTTKGDIVVELFENEAPATVANMISLVEDGKYSNMLFHRVIKDFMAQTGMQYTDKQYSAIPYTIYDECKEEDARFHFRGTLSMANTGHPDSGNIQFFFCHRALSHLDGLHTVFGRVISGMDVMEEISKTHYIGEKGEEQAMENPMVDHIISAEVIRKRDHVYEVQKAVGN